MAYRYQSDKDIKPKQKTYQIGVYKSAKQVVDSTFTPEVSLKSARIERDKAKELLSNNIDPTQQKNIDKNNFEQKDLFKVIAAAYINEKKETTPKNVQKIQGFLDNHILKRIGDYPIAAITNQDIIATGIAIQDNFEKRGKRTSETAHKCMGLISSIFEYAINILGYEIPNVALGRNKALRPHKTVCMKAVEQHQFPELLRNIDAYAENHSKAHPQTVAGLQLMALCFVRTKELRHFEWNEIDYHKNVWRIPAHKMKMRQDHIIPLSPQAMQIIERMRPITGETPYVFFNFQSGKPYSEAWFNQALNRMGYDGETYPKMTGHGFRKLASTGLYEMQYSEDVVEIQLAHLEQSSVKKRYDLSSHLAERQIMMNDWANHLDDLRAGKAKSFDLLTPDEIKNQMEKQDKKITNTTLNNDDPLTENSQPNNIDILKENLNNFANAIQVSLGMPENITIVTAIYKHNDCTALEQKNNLQFLSDVEDLASSYLQKNFKFDKDYFIKNITHFAYDYETSNFEGSIFVYALNKYIAELLSQINSSLDKLFIETPYFTSILSKYSAEEAKRLSAMIFEIIRIHLFKQMSFLAYKLEAYNIALMYHDFAMFLFSASNIQIGYDRNDYFEKMASLNASLASGVRWASQAEYRRRKKREYLAIMNEQGFKTYAETARYIKDKIDTDEKPLYEYVYKILREAATGNLD